MRFPILLVLVLFALASCQKEKNKLPSGYEYILHTNSNGPKVEPNAMVYFHYQMRNDDTVVTSSYGEVQMPMIMAPDSTTVGRELSPIEEAILLMREGDSLTIIAPMDTVNPKPQGFEKSKFLYYDIAVRSVKGPKDLEKAEKAVKAKVDKIIADYKANKLTKLQTTASGLKYIVHEEGSGMRPDSGDLVFVHYYGALTDGTMFDNSFVRGSEFPFQLGTGGVIPGWDEGIALLKAGSKATLFVPAELGYGASGAGSIPPNSELIFYVELVSARML